MADPVRAPGKDTLGRDIGERNNRLRLPSPKRVSQEWRLAASCRDTNPRWFVGDATKRERQLAIDICSRCPVTEPCAQEQRLLRAPGVWAGVWWTETGGGNVKRVA